jgi:light-regulated signal transduction histidine kinase (bacteriophytochrome)
LTETAQTIVSQLQKNEPERRVEVTIKPGMVVTGDARLLRVALENLIGNAWKFTRSRALGKIEFDVTESVPQKEIAGQPKLIYFVRDNGVGFDMQFADKLFAAFQRLHETRQFPGNGIGLATVQRIIRHHGGSVWAEGAVDKGATFYFTL